MSCPVFWPTESFLDPVGNTSAVSLTRDLPPEVDADILLLNCNDCRNVLFTIFCEHPNSSRKLDFTCSDVEPAILARAIILFTMAIDGTPCDELWNIFYHRYLDEASFSTLVAHCRKLVGLTQSHGDWAESAYGAVVKFGSQFTFTEVHRLLSLYVDWDSGIEGPARADWTFTNILHSFAHSSARSAGPMYREAQLVFQEHVELYFQTGTTFTEERDRDSAVHRNPTLYYSRHGDSLVHPCTDPLAPFHTAPVFGNTDSDSVSVADVVGAARREFGLWCRAFRAAALKTGRLLIVRFLLGDPLAVARTFEHFGRWKMRTSLVFVAPWSAQVLELSAEEYEGDQAPGIFNVIDTSTLWDTVGMYNILPSTTPILSTSPRSYSVLYTASFVGWFDNPKTGLAGYHFVLFSEIALWIGLCPSDCFTQFSSRFNPEDRFGEKGRSVTRRHDILAWKRPSSGDIVAHNHPSPQITFQQPGQLASILNEMYRMLFGDAYWTYVLFPGLDSLHRGIQHEDYYYSTRESFVCMLKRIRERFRLSPGDWDHIMEVFFKTLRRRVEQPMESNEKWCEGELRAQLFRHGLYAPPDMVGPAKPIAGRLLKWSEVPALVRIYLVVPRAEVGSGLRDIVRHHGTSGLAISLQGDHIRGLYQCLHPVFGAVVDTGTDTVPDVRVEEDPLGKRGTSDLVVSFVVDVASLCDVGDSTAAQMDIEIELFVFASLEAVPAEIGRTPTHRHTIFQTTLDDRTSVFISPEPFLPSLDYSTDPCTWLGAGTGLSATLPMPLGNQGVVQVANSTHENDHDDEVHRYTFQVTLAVHDARINGLLRKHGTKLLKIALVSLCTTRLTLAGTDIAQDVVYPLPVAYKPPTMQLRRSSNGEVTIIELTAQAALPNTPDAGGLHNITPVTLDGDIICPWDIHRVYLDRMPAVNLHAPSLEPWLLKHLSDQFSVTETMLKTNSVQHAPIPAPMWRLPKDSLTDALRTFTPGQLNKFGRPYRIIRLSDTSMLDHPFGPSDTILFMSGLRYDLTGHTVVADAYLLTIAPPLTESILSPLIHKDALRQVPLCGEELRMWKQLLPALAERCRSWSHGPNCEYKATGRIPLQTRLHAGDPLCNCGRGKDVEGLRRVKAWAPFAPHVTRVALSPLFPLTAAEPILMKFLRSAGAMSSDWRPRPITDLPRCRGCGITMKELKRCRRCRQKDVYCSEECQRKDWPRHKEHCIGLITGKR